MNPTIIQQQGARGDRAVAIGAFLLFLVTGFFGEEPPVVEPRPGHRTPGSAPAAAAPAVHP